MSSEPKQTLPPRTQDQQPGREVAPCYLFLACADSSYVTASVLHPDGGDATES